MASRVLSGSFAGQSAIVSDADGSFVLPGIGVVTARLAFNLELDQGDFSLTGGATTSAHGYMMPAATGVLALTGFDATYALVEPIVDHGDFILSGGDMLRHLSAKFYGGEIDLQGMDVGGGLAIPTTGGTFALTGYSVTFYAIGKLFHTGYFDLAGGDMRRGLTAKLHSSAYELTGFPLAGRSGRTRRMEAGRFSLSGVKSSIKIVRLGGVSGVGAIQWREAGATLVDWIS